MRNKDVVPQKWSQVKYNSYEDFWAKPLRIAITRRLNTKLNE